MGNISSRPPATASTSPPSRLKPPARSVGRSHPTSFNSIKVIAGARVHCFSITLVHRCMTSNSAATVRTTCCRPSAFRSPLACCTISAAAPEAISGWTAHLHRQQPVRIHIHLRAGVLFREQCVQAEQQRTAQRDQFQDDDPACEEGSGVVYLIHCRGSRQPYRHHLSAIGQPIGSIYIQSGWPGTDCNLYRRRLWESDHDKHPRQYASNRC